MNHNDKPKSAKIENPVLTTVEIRASDCILLNAMFGVAHTLTQHPEVALQIPEVIPILGSIIAVQRSGHSNNFISNLSKMIDLYRDEITSEMLITAKLTEESLSSEVNRVGTLKSAIDMLIRLKKNQENHNEQSKC